MALIRLRICAGWSVSLCWSRILHRWKSHVVAQMRNCVCETMCWPSLKILAISFSRFLDYNFSFSKKHKKTREDTSEKKLVCYFWWGIDKWNLKFFNYLWSDTWMQTWMYGQDETNRPNNLFKVGEHNIKYTSR